MPPQILWRSAQQNLLHEQKCETLGKTTPVGGYRPYTPIRPRRALKYFICLIHTSNMLVYHLCTSLHSLLVMSLRLSNSTYDLYNQAEELYYNGESSSTESYNPYTNNHCCALNHSSFVADAPLYIVDVC